MNDEKKAPPDSSKKNWWMEIDHQSDVENLEGSKEAKDLLLEFDDVEVPEDDEFFNRLHSKIMIGVEMTAQKKDGRTFWQKNQKIARGFTAAAIVLSVLLVSLETQQIHLASDATDQVLSDAVSRSPDIQETVLVYENKDDFFVDLAQESLDHLSVDRLQGLIGSQVND